MDRLRGSASEILGGILLRHGMSQGFKSNWPLHNFKSFGSLYEIVPAYDEEQSMRPRELGQQLLQVPGLL